MREPAHTAACVSGRLPVAGTGLYATIEFGGARTLPRGQLYRIMKAIVIKQFGGADTMTYADWPDPKPAPGEALVKLEYAGVNFTDIYQRSGQYAHSHTYQTPLPMVIGMEGGGTVAALGAGVTQVKVGDRVAY